MLPHFLFRSSRPRASLGGEWEVQFFLQGQSQQFTTIAVLAGADGIHRCDPRQGQPSPDELAFQPPTTAAFRCPVFTHRRQVYSCVKQSSTKIFNFLHFFLCGFGPKAV